MNIEVLQRNNVQKKAETITPVWLNSVSGGVWTGSSLTRCFNSLCKAAGIEQRGTNQCRHTFASRMLTLGAPQEFIARHLGHADTEMLRKHYGRFIPEDNEGRDAALMNNLIAGAERQ